MPMLITSDSAVASGGGALPRMCVQGFGGYSPTFAGNDFDCLMFLRVKVNCYKNKRPPRWPKNGK